MGYDGAVKQGQYYCSVGAENAFGRVIVEEHLEACVNAGIQISGVNAEVAPGQGNFKLVLVWALNKETICGWHVFYYIELQKITVLQLQ